MEVQLAKSKLQGMLWRPAIARGGSWSRELSGWGSRVVSADRLALVASDCDDMVGRGVVE